MDDRKELMKARLAIFGGIAFVVIVIVASIIGMVARDEQQEAELSKAQPAEKPTDEVIATGAQDSFYRLMAYFLHGADTDIVTSETFDLNKSDTYYYNVILEKEESAKEFGKRFDEFKAEYDEAKIAEIQIDRRADYMENFQYGMNAINRILNEMPKYSKDYLYSYYVGYGVDAVSDMVANSLYEYKNDQSSRAMSEYTTSILLRENSILSAYSLAEEVGCLKVNNGSWKDGDKVLDSSSVIECAKNSKQGDRLKSLLAMYDSYNNSAKTTLKRAMMTTTMTMFTVRDTLEEQR